ncbi:MAG TPA: chorismate mutase [Rhizomicrobium sp.]|jgi:isochorismate pyruvate lyase|nr:chorismate mutase [Rhizomicrobium sp.]
MHNDAPAPPEACSSMTELREAIDTLDRQLVGLLARRQRYVERAAILKQNRTAVRDEGRVEEVIAKVIAEGRKAGLSPDIAGAVWRSLIDASIVHEFSAFDGKSSAN